MAAVRKYVKHFHDGLNRYLSITVVSKQISQADGFLLYFTHPFSPVKHTAGPSTNTEWIKEYSR